MDMEAQVSEMTVYTDNVFDVVVKDEVQYALDREVGKVSVCRNGEEEISIDIDIDALAELLDASNPRIWVNDDYYRAIGVPEK